MKKIASLLCFLLIIVVVYWSFSDMMPSKNYEKELSKTGFIVPNALSHLKEISQKPHYTGSDEHKIVQNYIVHELEKLGLKPSIQVQSAINKKGLAATTTENIIARIKGTGSEKALLLLTHYDSNPHSSLGASDAGSGVVVLLEGIRSFLVNNKTPKNDIVILISDAEEIGLLGAEAFVSKHPWAKDIGLVLNFEARGSGGPSYMLMETNGKNSKLLSEFIKANVSFPAASSLMYSVYKKLPNDTDLTVFRENADIDGFNFAFIGDHFDYHTAQDSYQRLDRETLLHQADYFTKTVPYFANSNLNDFKSNEDFIYVNFPFVKLLTYSFSWILPLIGIAVLLFLFLLYFGISLNKITVKGLLKGFIPFLIALVLCTGVSFGLWKFLLIIHPGYTDILQGFTYNGYQYIMAFVCLNLWMIFKIYKRFFKTENSADLTVAPLFIWLLVNLLIYWYLPGAGFFIIPVFMALFILGIHIFLTIPRTTKLLLSTVLSIPVIYIFAPMIKMFPVGLGLKNLFISALFLVLVFGLISPIFQQSKSRNRLTKLIGFMTIITFGLATFNSGFSLDKKKPNSLVFIQNMDTNAAYYATYNNVLDDYTNAMLGENPTKVGAEIIETQSKYNTPYTYDTKTTPKALVAALISIEKDSVFEGNRTLNFTISPQRKVNKIELMSKETIRLKEVIVNGVYISNPAGLADKKGTFLVYHLGNKDQKIEISLIIDTEVPPNIMVNEISYDLLEHPLFNIPSRTNEMMPMPFVTNDAIICLQKLHL